MDLGLDGDDLNSCVQCGLCLPHCPTYRVTGDETLSPRGRISLMREVQNHDAPVTREVLQSFETCVQCRGCEPACPSGVPYGQLMEQTRETLAGSHRMTPRWQRLALKPLTRPKLLGLGFSALSVAQRLRVLPDRLGISGSIPFRQDPLPTTGDDVYLFTGCVLDAMQRDVHRAALQVLNKAGLGVIPTNDLAPCCGALHTHAGLTDNTRDLAERMIANLHPGKPVIVDSAGCGAAMKDYGRLLGTKKARAFSNRVYDVQEFVADHLDALPDVDPLDLTVAVQDPCHLRHVQKVHEATRKVLRPYVRELIELDDEGLCCGAGGAYSIFEPELAGLIRERKLGAIDRANPDVVASANPGCSMHLESAGVPTRHPMELVREALDQRGFSATSMSKRMFS